MGIGSCTVLPVVCHIVLLGCLVELSSADSNNSITNGLMLEALSLVLWEAGILC